jgi:hypothetical protein
MPRGIPRSREIEAAETSEAPMSARATEMRRERRRREPGDVDVMARQKLAIPPEVQAKLEREGMTSYWFLDQPGRIQQAESEDWDIVPGVPPVSASRSDDSQQVLMAKRKDWFETDRAHLGDLNKSNEKAALKGDIGDASVSRDGFYAPTGTPNRISRGA